MSKLRQRLAGWALLLAAWLGRRPPSAVPAAVTARHNAEIEQWESNLLQRPQVDCPVTNHFGPGVYLREVLMPAGSLVIGHQHNTEHLNIMLKGRAKVLVDGQVKAMTAPCIVASRPGTRKVALVEEDMVWVTIHPTHETDLEKLEGLLITKSPAFLTHAERAQLEPHMENALCPG